MNIEYKKTIRDRCKYFKIYELVTPEIYDKYGEKAWWFINPLLSTSLDDIREGVSEEIGRPIYIKINTWYYHQIHNTGEVGFTESGLRDFNTTTGAKMSIHKLGGAADLKPVGISCAKLRQHILANPVKYPFVRAVEIRGTWVHIDVRATGSDTVMIIR